MSRENWRNIRQSKRFYVSTYRWLIVSLIFSVTLNLVLELSIYAVYFNRKPVRYYATNGERPLIELTALSKKNETSVPLLVADPPSEVLIKAAPE